MYWVLLYGFHLLSGPLVEKVVCQHMIGLVGTGAPFLLFLPGVEQYFHACWVVGWRASLASLVKDAWYVTCCIVALCSEWSLVNKSGVSEIEEVY